MGEKAPFIVTTGDCIRYSLSVADYFFVCSVLASIILTLQVLFLLGSVMLFVNGNEPEVQKKVITRLYMKKVWRDMRM